MWQVIHFVPVKDPRCRSLEMWQVIIHLVPVKDPLDRSLKPPNVCLGDIRDHVPYIGLQSTVKSTDIFKK
jgi:hypothetical protein